MRRIVGWLLGLLFVLGFSITTFVVMYGILELLV